MLAGHWWFWTLVAAIVVVLIATEPRWRAAIALARTRAIQRHLVEAGPGQGVESRAGGAWSEPSLPAVLVGAWVCASPWIWGYDDVDGAIAADVTTGAAIALVAVASVAFPAALALNLLAGLWLVTAPWIVGYGTDDGAVGLSDTFAGIATCALALHGMAVATRRVRAATPGPIGRVPNRR